MAELKIPIRLDKSQALTDAQATAQELLKIFRAADNSAAASSKELQKVKAQAAKDASSVAQNASKQEAAARQSELKDLQSAIKARYRAEDDAAKATAAIVKAAAASARAEAKADTAARQSELKSLQDSIKARYRSQEESAKAAARAEREMHQSSIQGSNEAAEATKSFNGELVGLIKTYAGISAFVQVARSIATAFKNTSDEIERQAKAFQGLRKQMQSVASLSGQPNTTKFTLSEIDKASAANVTPGEFKDFRDSFLSRGSLYVGKGPNAKLDDANADQFEGSLAEFAAQKGVSENDMGEFGGGLLAQAKGPQTAALMKKQAGRVFNTLEASSAPVAHLLPQLTRLRAQGFSAEEGAQVLAQMPEIAPEEEGTYALRAVSALRDRAQEGKGGEFGVSKGMSPYEMLRSAVSTIQKQVAAGGNLDDIVDKASHNEEIAGKALRGLVNQGSEGMDQWKGVLESTPDNALDQTIKEGRETEPGRQRAVDARLAAEQAKMGARGDRVTRLRGAAETELTAAGKFESPDWRQMPMELNPFADSMKDRQVNLQMIQRGRAQLGETSGIGDAAASTSNLATNRIMEEMLDRLDKIMASNQEIASRPQPTGPLSAPPPDPATRMGLDW